MCYSLPMLPSQAHLYSRRSFLRVTAQSSAFLAAGGLHELSAQTPAPGLGKVEPALTRYIANYMQAMYAPGMTLALVHADGTVDTAAFGMSDVTGRVPVTPAMLFEIGSISKSFCALALLQMRDEGKLDLQRPILDYLPWLPLDTPLGATTAHHLLTHTAGLDHEYPLFRVDPNARIPQTFKPGSQFAYSNLGYQILGFLAAHIDGKTYASVLQTRLLDRLGMKATRPAIHEGIWAEQAQSYTFFRDDLATVRATPLRRAPGDVFTQAAGCVASTPADMALYLRMLLAHGDTRSGRLISEESFRLFATPHIKAEEFGKTASYGYGVAVDTLDGHSILWHTGGMRSFASAFHADLDGKVAAFASINAMQGYRPVPVTRYAVQIMRAQAEGKPVPAPAPLADAQVVENAADYAGVYTGADGTVQIVAEGKALVLVINSARARLESSGGGDDFVALDERWQAYPWKFERDKAASPGPKAAVTQLLYGPHWYVAAGYQGAKSFPDPAHQHAFAGKYSDGSGVTEAYFLRGALMLDGVQIEELEGGLFRPTDEPNSPHRVQFLYVIDGRAQMLVYDGSPSLRIETQ